MEREFTQSQIEELYKRLRLYEPSKWERGVRTFAAENNVLLHREEIEEILGQFEVDGGR
jgi:hypothetical protein